VQWKDGNVNHPLAAYCTLICGGEICSQAWAVDLGTRRLAEFRRCIGDRQFRCRRQAEMSEYNSPTYTALNLCFLAVIGEHAVHKEARRLALFLEQQLWIDVAMHFHAQSAQFSGPHSRSYQDDSFGGYSALHCTMLAAFDWDVPIFPELAYQFDHPSSLIENSLIAILRFHVPAAAERIALQKEYPYYFRKTTYCEAYHENSTLVSKKDAITRFAFDDEIYHGGWSDLTTYMTQEFALGSSSLPYVNAGHADSFMLRMRSRPIVGSLGDFRSVYTRGVFNGAKAGQANQCHVTGKLIDASYLYEEGRSAVYQHKNRAIVNYTPKRAGHLGVEDFRVDILFTYLSSFNHLLINGEQVRDLPMFFPAGSRLIFQNYKTYGVIIPCPVVPGADKPIRLWECNSYLGFSLCNYEGERRDFSREEISRWRSGFVIELATVDQFPTLEDFVVYTAALSVEESIGPDATRHTVFHVGDDVMEMTYDPLRELIVSNQWNGAEERTTHMSVEAGGRTEGEDCPHTLFGSEIFQLAQE